MLEAVSMRANEYFFLMKLCVCIFHFNLIHELKDRSLFNCKNQDIRDHFSFEISRMWTSRYLKCTVENFFDDNF